MSALDTLTACLCLVKRLPRSDANVFPEYVLPAIAPLANDPATIVRVAYAQNIATLAETAVRFLEQSQLSSAEGPVPNYENELHDLHEMLSNTVIRLLTDSQSIVRQTLMESGIIKLCVFLEVRKQTTLFCRMSSRSSMIKMIRICVVPSSIALSALRRLSDGIARPF